MESGKDDLAHCWNQAAQALEKSGRFRTKAAEELLNEKLSDRLDSCFSANAEESTAKFMSNCWISIAKPWEAVALSKKNEALAMKSRDDVTSTSGGDDDFVALWKDVADAHEQIANCRNKVIEAALDHDPSSFNFWSELANKWSRVADAREKNIKAIQHGNREQAAAWARLADNRLESIHQYIAMSGRNLFF